MGYFVYSRKRIGSGSTRFKFRETAKLFGLLWEFWRSTFVEQEADKTLRCFVNVLITTILAGSLLLLLIQMLG